MNSDMRKLVDLQALDSEFIRTQRTIKAGPEELQAARAALEEAREAMRETAETAKRLAADADAQSLEIKTVEAEIEKVRTQMGMVKNSKEYEMLKNAMSSLNQRREDFENAALALMEKVDSVKETLEPMQAAEAEAAAKLADLEAEIAGEVGELRQKAATLREKRKALVTTIDPEALASYERALRANRGSAVTTVADGACQGCFRQLNPDLTSQVYHGEKLVQCQSCHRFLYAEEQPDEAEA